MDLVPDPACAPQRDADGVRVKLPESRAVDWSASRRTVYQVQQHFRYEYAAPIRDLRQRLVVVPRPVHGDVYRHATALTRPNGELRAVAAELARSGEKGADLVAAVTSWVYGRMSYGFGRTGVHSTAAEALAAGQGVCRDYAHVMLALCRLLAMPARYVSGHLVGEGGTHAWVEVLAPARGRMVETEKRESRWPRTRLSRLREPFLGAPGRYQHMGLLPRRRPASWYDPGRFWSGDRIELVAPFALRGGIAVR